MNTVFVVVAFGCFCLWFVIRIYLVFTHFEFDSASLFPMCWCVRKKEIHEMISRQENWKSISSKHQVPVCTMKCGNWMGFKHFFFISVYVEDSCRGISSSRKSNNNKHADQSTRSRFSVVIFLFVWQWMADKVELIGGWVFLACDWITKH